MTPHILIAEDEQKIASVLSDYLDAAGMRVTHVEDGSEVAACVERLAPDLLLLDVMLPNKDGMAICRELRAKTNLPIIMVTARVEEIDRLLGLELGADDYMCKPFSPREVVARVKAILRRASPDAYGNGAESSIEMNEDRLQASVNGRRLGLTPVEFKLLHVLAKHPGRIYRRAELLDLVYDDYRDVSDRTIDSHIKNLRRKLEGALPKQEVIYSVYGVGYKLEM